MGSLFKAPKIPKPPPEAPMPDMQDLQARMAKRNAMADAQRRRGRESTIMGTTLSEGISNKTGSLGGPQ